jgi:hypothetical protein
VVERADTFTRLKQMTVLERCQDTERAEAPVTPYEFEDVRE